MLAAQAIGAERAGLLYAICSHTVETAGLHQPRHNKPEEVWKSIVIVCVYMLEVLTAER